MFPIPTSPVYNGAMADARAIQAFIIDAVQGETRGVAGQVSREFGISRQAANRHISRLVREGLLLADGRTRSRTYSLAVLDRVERTIPITEDLEEHSVWEKLIRPLVMGVPENVLDICNYGFTEMLNNAKDHSGSSTVTVTAWITAAAVVLRVEDAGVGIFRKLQQALKLEDERHAILELAKGKVTTDPARHTGEGIFFTSRMFDYFGIDSGRLFLGRMRQTNDYLIEAAAPQAGTRVTMNIATSSVHDTLEVFDRYATDQEDYAFKRTHVVVSLAQSAGEKLVSRSQAKRVVARLERFKEVLLDFKGIGSIGPAFADEIFRVFRTAHPDVRLEVINATEEVQRMIRRADAASAEGA